MKIESYKKINNTNYELSLDNGESISLHEDLILKHQLLLKKELTKSELDFLLKENDFYLALDMARKLIGRKDQSVFEVETYLKRKEIVSENISLVIDKLLKEGVLNEKRYVSSFVHDKILLSNDGPYKIRQLLKDKKIPDYLVEEELSEHDDSMWKERIVKLQNKYLKQKSNKSLFVAKNDLYQYLSNLGYDRKLILDTLDMSSYDEDAARVKEAEKQRLKLARKYSGEELEKKIQQKLYEKGFKRFDWIKSFFVTKKQLLLQLLVLNLRNVSFVLFV